MKITTARRIAQVFFFGTFVWLAVVASVGTRWIEWRGWPIRWFLELDPLTAVGTVLSTHSFHPALGWSLVTIALTLLFGRVFCGFVCPFGALHQFVGWIGRRWLPKKARIADNAYRPAQSIKYYILIAMLAAAAFCTAKTFSGVLQTGLLDPIPLFHRTVNLVLLPAADASLGARFPGGRLAVGAFSIGVLFLALVLINLWRPRFFCRYLCPLGALLGILARGAWWSIGRRAHHCTECSLCDVDCEGACHPQGPIRISECLMCMNCLETCPTKPPLTYLTRPSGTGEITTHGITRRGFVAATATGLAAVPLVRLGAHTATGWSPALIRPPGSVAEEEFLARCVKCDQCIRVCPTNALQPAGLEHGWEALWTPALNHRVGTSGCQLNCIACGHACPTGAIRALSLDEKLGHGSHASNGPVRIGLAAVDRGRCLPWAMQRPCIVCEENCPVTPKAIHVSMVDEVIPDGDYAVTSVDGATVELAGAALPAQRLGSGDYFCRFENSDHSHPIIGNTATALTLATESMPSGPPAPGARVSILVRLQRPVVDPDRCIGCGICEHECPMNGLRAIRVTADNETRDPAHTVMLGGAGLRPASRQSKTGATRPGTSPAATDSDGDSPP